MLPFLFPLSGKSRQGFNEGKRVDGIRCASWEDQPGRQRKGWLEGDRWTQEPEAGHCSGEGRGHLELSSYQELGRSQLE